MLRLPAQRHPKSGNRFLATADIAQHLAQLKLGLHRVAVRFQRLPIAQHGIYRSRRLLVCLSAREPFAVFGFDHPEILAFSASRSALGARR